MSLRAMCYVCLCCASGSTSRPQGVTVTGAWHHSPQRLCYVCECLTGGGTPPTGSSGQVGTQLCALGQDCLARHSPKRSRSMLYDYERLWHCRMRCAVVHYAVCMWAAHLAVFMYGCALVQYAVCMWVAHLAVFMYGCAIVQYAVCMWVAHPAVFMCCG